MNDDPFVRFYPLARRAAQVRSAAAVGSGKLLAADRPDMEQTIIIRVWEALPNYVPERGAPSTFVEHVVRNESVSFLRRESRRLRPVAEPPLEEPVDSMPSLELRVDIQTGISLLPERERDVATGLMAHCPTEVGRRLGIARSTVYERMRAIRQRFESIGLGRGRR